MSKINSPSDPDQCKHIKKVASLDVCASRPLLLDENVLESFPFPPSVKKHLQEVGTPDAIIQRVSRTSFVIRTMKKSFQHPLQLLHIRMDVHGSIHCQCSEYKSTSTVSAVHTSLRLSKRCIHFYVGLWALLSCRKMQLEFSLQLQEAVKGKTLDLKDWSYVHNYDILTSITMTF